MKHIKIYESYADKFNTKNDFFILEFPIPKIKRNVNIKNKYALQLVKQTGLITSEEDMKTCILSELMS